MTVENCYAAPSVTHLSASLAPAVQLTALAALPPYNVDCNLIHAVQEAMAAAEADAADSRQVADAAAAAAEPADSPATAAVEPRGVLRTLAQRLGLSHSAADSAAESDGAPQPAPQQQRADAEQAAAEHVAAAEAQVEANPGGVAAALEQRDELLSAGIDMSSGAAEAPATVATAAEGSAAASGKPAPPEWAAFVAAQAPQQQPHAGARSFAGQSQLLLAVTCEWLRQRLHTLRLQLASQARPS